MSNAKAKNLIAKGAASAQRLVGSAFTGQTGEIRLRQQRAGLITDYDDTDENCADDDDDDEDDASNTGELVATFAPNYSAKRTTDGLLEVYRSKMKK